MAGAPLECIPPDSRTKEQEELKKTCEVCDDKETCQVDFNDKYWDCIMDFGTGDALTGCCKICQDDEKYLRADEISPWTYHILAIRKLQQGGYPYEKNDLEYEEWQDLGSANETIENIKQQNIIKALIPKASGM